MINVAVTISRTITVAVLINMRPAGTCDDATANNTLGTTIATIASGGEGTITDSLIKDTAGATLHSVPAETEQVISDADVNVNAADFGSVKAEGAINIPIKNTALTNVGSKIGANWLIGTAAITNSDASYNDTVVAEGTKVLADIQFTDSDLVVTSVPAQTNIVATPCAAINTATCVQLNDPTTGLTQTQRDFIQKSIPTKTGQTTSYATGDDGDLEKGRCVDFFTMDCLTPDGTTARFFQEIIGADTVIRDWATGLMWRKSIIGSGSVNWANSIAGAIASAYGGFSGWRVPNRVEFIQIANMEQTQVFNYSPFSINFGDRLWTSTTYKPSTTNAYTFIGTNGQDDIVGKTSLYAYMICRNF